MRLRPVGVIFPTVPNKGSQFGSSIGNRKGLADPRQTKGGKGSDLLMVTSVKLVEIRDCS